MVASGNHQGVGRLRLFQGIGRHPTQLLRSMAPPRMARSDASLMHADHDSDDEAAILNQSIGQPPALTKRRAEQYLNVISLGARPLTRRSRPQERTRLLLRQGPLLSCLQSCVDQSGVGAWSVAPNVSDQVFCPRDKPIDSSGGLTGWAGRLQAFLAGAEVDRIDRFGSVCPAHVMAWRVVDDAEENNAPSSFARRSPPSCVSPDVDETRSRGFASCAAMRRQDSSSPQVLCSAPLRRVLFYRRFAAFSKSLLWARDAWRQPVKRVESFAPLTILELS